MTQTDQQNNINDLIANVEKAVNRAFSTGKVDRAQLTREAQEDATLALQKVKAAIDADEIADEAAKIAIITANSRDKENIQVAKNKERTTRKYADQVHKEATQSAKQAYQAIKFSAPNQLGFLRVVQLFFALHIVTTLLVLILTSRDTIVYSSVNIMDWIMIILEGVAFWFLINRYKVARPFIIAISALGVVASTVFDIADGTFSPFISISQNIFYIFLILYFIFSKRVKATLVNDISGDKGDYNKDNFVIERKGWPFIRNLIMYFIIFSVLGHWMEAGMCQFIRLGIVQGDYDPNNTMLWRDWLFPFGMEGAAVCLIALFLYPLKEWMDKKFSNRILPYVVSFITNALLCTLIEFSMGLIFNANLQNWDYSDMFCNIMGQVCLQNTLAFGVAASLITWFVYPLMERWIARVPYAVMNIAFVVVVIFGAILFALYWIAPPQEFDLGNVNSPEAVVQREQDNTRNSVKAASEDATALQERITGADYLTQEQRETIQVQIDTILQSYDTIAKVL